MKPKRQIGLAVGGSVLGHLLLAGGATAILAFKRSSPPANDDFADGALLRGGLIAAANGDNFYATREFSEPAHVGTVAGGSVWWRWTAPDACAVEVTVEAAEFEEVVAVYRGVMLGTLTEVAARQPGDGRPLRFMAEADTTYHIAVAGSSYGDLGRISLNLLADPQAEDPEDLDEELVLLLPEMFEIEEEPEEPENPEDELKYLRTTGQEREVEVPEDARFESDRNTHAASELAPSPDGEDDMPTTDGEEFPFGDLVKREYVDGEFIENSALPVTAEWKPEPPAVSPLPPIERVEVASAAMLPEAPPLEEVEVPELHEAVSTTEVAVAASPTEAPRTNAPALPESVVAIETIESAPLESAVEEVATVESSEFAAGKLLPETLPDLPVGPLPEVDVVEEERVEPEPTEPVETALASATPPAAFVPPPPPDPAPESTPPAEPVEPAPDKERPDEPAFETETIKKRSVGRLSNRGERVALDAAETPLGHYKRKVDQAVQRSWQRARRMNGDLATYGILKVRFWINRSGKIVDFRVLENNANAATVSFSITGIKAAPIPPMPEELFERTQDGRMEFEYYIILH